MARFKVKESPSSKPLRTVSMVSPGDVFTLREKNEKGKRDTVNGRPVGGEYFLRTDDGAVYLRTDEHFPLEMPSDPAEMVFGDAVVEDVFEVEEFKLRRL